MGLYVSGIVERGKSNGFMAVDTRANFRGGISSLYPRPAYSGITDVLTTIYKEGGVRKLYRGVGQTLTGILPYAGILHVPVRRCKETDAGILN
ncbi:Mitochondrial substrate/solute carrier [Corchorus olitorius]|uniref:Mitochondrial substrate/solute carrier n=1 Tax=Corchorus olitorius TaxID=93759 RepID=A0A1R3GW45_9ROSI|nr:Mitochondrial substrate/solute carrier [Corchorus olitorius]